MTTLDISHLDKQERGAALIVSLALLAAITFIGIFTMSNSRLEWLMTSNSYFQSDAGFRAEAAARDGITWALTSDPHHTSPATLPPADPRVARNWDISPLHTYVSNAYSITSPGTNQYYVEYMGCNDASGAVCGPCSSDGIVCIYTYQVWGRASDGKGTNRITQATVLKQETTHRSSNPLAHQSYTYTSTLQSVSYANITQ